MKKRYLLLFIVVILLATACKPRQEEKKPETVLTIAQSVDPKTLDPYETTVPYISIAAQICEPLIYWMMDNKGVPYIEKYLASDYTWLNNTTVQFKLREGIKFTNGEPFDAEAVKVSLELLFSAYNYSQWLEGLLKDIVIVDNKTVNVILNHYSPVTESVLAMGSFIVPPKDLKARGREAMIQAPIGTGPWVFKEHVSDSHVTLTANKDYWRGTPEFDTVIIRAIPDDNSRVAALEAGEIDLAPLVPLSAVSRLEKNTNLTMSSVPGLRQFATFFDTNNPKARPLRDVRVRLALNYAIDRAGMCEMLFQGRGAPMDGQFLSRNHIGYNPNLSLYPFDPQKAKQLLTEAGYPNGFEVDYTYTSGRYPQDKQAGEAISSYLRAIGLAVNERAVDYPEWARQFDAGQNTALYTVGFSFGQDGYLSLSSYGPGKRFRTSIMPKAFDDALAKIEQGGTMEQRVQYIKDAMAAINTEPFAVYLYNLDDLYCASAKAKGFAPRPDQRIDLVSWAVKRK